MAAVEERDELLVRTLSMLLEHKLGREISMQELEKVCIICRTLVQEKG